MVWETFSDVKGVVTRTREPSRVGDHERVERDSSARPPLHRLSKPAEELGADVSELAERVQAVGHLLRFHHVHGLMAARRRPICRRRPSAIAAGLSPGSRLQRYKLKFRARHLYVSASSSGKCSSPRASMHASATRCGRANSQATTADDGRPGSDRTDSTPCSAYYY